MTSSQIDDFCDFLGDLAKKDSVKADLHGFSKEETLVVFQKGNLKNHSLSDSRHLNLRVLKGARSGCSHTKDFSLKALKECYKNALDALRVSDKEDAGHLCEKEETWPDFSAFFDPSLGQIPIEKKINCARMLDQAGQKQSPIIKSVYSCVSDFDRYDFFANSKGIRSLHRQNGVSGIAFFLAMGPKSRSQASCEQSARSYKEMDFTAIGRKAGDKALKKQNGFAPKTGRYPVVFQAGQPAGTLALQLTDFLNGKQVFEGLSLFKNSLGKKLFSEKLSLKDRPLALWGLSAKAFDGEGFATEDTPLIEKGILKNYLTGSFHAKALKAPHTKKAAWNTNNLLDTAPFHLEMTEGKASLKDWTKAIPRFIVIDFLKGMAGYNPISGDFSIESEGFLWERGEMRPICQFTVSGHIRDVFSGIVQVARDSLAHNARVKAPSFLGPELMISGK